MIYISWKGLKFGFLSTINTVDFIAGKTIKENGLSSCNQRPFIEDRLLNRNEVENLFGLPKRFLEVSATRGDGPPMVRLGRLVRYRVADIREWIDEARVVSNTSGR